jgi:hypothetical protein
MVSFTVTFRPFQSLVAFAMSSPTFFGDCKLERKRRDEETGVSECDETGITSHLLGKYIAFAPEATSSSFSQSR